MRRFLIIPLLLLLGLQAQTPADNYWTEFTGSTILTIQQPATSSRQVQFQTAWFYCAAAQTITLTWNGAAATTTAGTAVPFPPTLNAASAKVFTASNVGAGATTGPVYNVPAGVTYPVSLANFKLGATNLTNKNLNFTPNGSCTMDVTWQEFQ